MSYCNIHTKHFFLLICLSLFVSKILGYDGKYPIQNFAPADYRAGNQNIDFAQNRNMSIFVANNLGVLSYNGNVWELYSSDTGKKKRALLFDSITNRLYAGSQGDFGYYDQDWTYVSLLEKVPEQLRGFDEVWDVYQVDGKIYFCTFTAIYVYDNEHITVIENENGLNRSFEANDQLFTQHSQGGLLEIQGDELITSLPQENSNSILSGLLPYNDGFLLFYNSGNIEFSNPLGTIPFFPKLVNSLRGTYVNHVLQLSNGKLVVSTQTSGLFLYDIHSKTIENITSNEGLLSNACLKSFQDFSGNLWVGMQNGIALIHINSPMRFLSDEIDLRGSGYDSFKTEEGRYFSTSNGIYFLENNSRQSRLLAGTEGPAYSFAKIANQLYCGHHTGLFQLKNGQALKVANTNGLWKIQILKSHQGYALAGTYSGLYLFRFDEQQYLEPVQLLEGFYESSRFFEEDNLGKIWVGQFYKGLYRLSLSSDLSSVASEKVQNQFPNLPLSEQVLINSIDNEIHIGTSAGIYRYLSATGEIERAAMFEEAIGDQPVYLLEQDALKNIYVVAENNIGFYRQISKNNYAYVPSSLFQMRYSFSNDLLNLSKNEEQGVLFSANEGFIEYNPEKESTLTIDYPLIINKIYSVNQDSLLYRKDAFSNTNSVNGLIQVSPKDKVLQIEVESFQYQDVNNRQFRYFLEGFDENFTDWSTSSKKEYTNLREGKYKFVAQSRNYLGEITTSQSIHLRVRPPLHRSLLAKILYAIIAIFVFVAVARIQRRKYRKRAEILEKNKRRELAEKQQKLQEMQESKEKEIQAEQRKRAEVEQKKEEELSQLREEKLESELRHLNNLLAASTMNLVVKNEFIETVKDELKEVKKGGKPETRYAIDSLVKEIDTNLKLQEDWERFEHHFDQVHGDFLDRIRSEFHDLTPQDQKLCAYLRLNLSTKEIAQLLSISIRGVEVARYRLRKRLNMETNQNLSKFILEY